MDGNAELVAFADKLEKATIDTIEEGKMTKDLALITTLENPTVLNSEGFIKAIEHCKANEEVLKLHCVYEKMKRGLKNICPESLR